MKEVRKNEVRFGFLSFIRRRFKSKGERSERRVKEVLNVSLYKIIIYKLLSLFSPIPPARVICTRALYKGNLGTSGKIVDLIGRERIAWIGTVSLRCPVFGNR